MTKEKFFDYYWAGADGFNVESQAQNQSECMFYYFNVKARLNESFDEWTQHLNGTDAFNNYIEWTLALGNVSTLYEMCYNVTEYNYDEFITFMRTYNNTRTYLKYLLPNILSYAFDFDIWS